MTKIIMPLVALAASGFFTLASAQIAQTTVDAKQIVEASHGNAAMRSADRVLKFKPTAERKFAPASRAIQPRAMRKAAANASGAFFESFEGGTPASAWLPDGWTRTSEPASSDPTDHWFVYSQLPMIPAPVDGTQYMAIMYSSSYKDEWIITPEVEVPVGTKLEFYWWSQPLNIFKIDSQHVNYNTGEFISQEVAASLEVLVSENGGEWEKIFDVADQYMGMSYSDLRNVYYGDMKAETVQLDQYVGKNVKFAFRYVGTDGDSFVLDAVSIDIPTLQPFYAAAPYRQFFGLSLDGMLQAVTEAVEIYPVNVPIVWNNLTDAPYDAEYQWTYTNVGEDGKVQQFTTDDYDLEVTFRTNHESEVTLRNNILSMPSLTASAEGFHSGTFASPARYVQAGGRAEYQASPDVDYIRFGLLPFDLYSEGFGYHSEEELDFGRPRVPIFGYSADSDEWWRNYTFQGEAEPDEFAYVTGYMNWIIPNPDAPMVLYGASAAAIGKITDAANFRLEVRALNEDSEVIEEPIAVAYLSGKDAVTQVYSEVLGWDWISLNFHFDEPIVLDGNVSPYGYMVEVAGYHDGGVEYFAPCQSVKPNPYEYCLGFYRHHRKFAGVEDDNYSYVAYFSNENGELYTTFAISLDAAYPWLEAATQEVTIADEDVRLPISSFYDGSEYAVTAPEWLSVEVEGQYDKASVVFKVLTSADAPRHGKAIISAPGIEMSFDVTSTGPASISDIVAPDVNADLYNTQGILIKRNASAADLEALPAGLYIHGNKKVRVL